MFGEMFKLILISVVAVLLAVVLLSVRILFKKNGTFKSMHISDSKAMHQRGIGCVQSQDREARRTKPNKINVNEL